MVPRSRQNVLISWLDELAMLAILAHFVLTHVFNDFGTIVLAG